MVFIAENWTDNQLADCYLLPVLNLGLLSSVLLWLKKTIFHFVTINFAHHLDR